MRFREVKYLGQTHTASECDSNPLCLFSPITLPVILVKEKEARVSETRRLRGERVRERD